MSGKAPPRRPLLWRLAPVLAAAAALVIVGQIYGTHEVELLVRLPPGGESVAALDLRVTREDGRQVLRAHRERELTGGRTFVVDTRLPRGHFVVDAWPNGKEPALTAKLFFDGHTDEVEVDLQPRAPPPPAPRAP